jgi:hypothetical protein
MIDHINIPRGYSCMGRGYSSMLRGYSFMDTHLYACSWLLNQSACHLQYPLHHHKGIFHACAYVYLYACDTCMYVNMLHIPRDIYSWYLIIANVIKKYAPPSVCQGQ